jgi:nucleoside-diphosphate-sugar epimerase
VKTLLTGAAGFAGQGAVEVLGAEHWLRCADIRPSPEPRDGETIICDLTSAADAERAVEGIDAVVHMAMGPVPGPDDAPELLMQTNVVATANLLWAARRAGIERFVHMSSGAVIEGHPRDTYIHAGLPHKFSGLYCLTKSLQERLAEQYAVEYGMTIPALRPWVIVDSRAMSHRFTDTLSRDDPDWFGFVCRYDLAEACRLALTADLEGFQPFHIMATAKGRRMFDVDRTEALLGWRPTVTFDDL